MIVDSGFWADKRVLVTGHTGFKGGWLSLWLEAMGAETHGFSLAPPTRPNLYEEASVAKGLPAPPACVEAVAGSVTMAFDEGLRNERRLFMQLLGSAESPAPPPPS